MKGTEMRNDKTGDSKVIQLVTKTEQQDKDLKGVFLDISKRLEKKDAEISGYHKAVIILLDDSIKSVDSPNYEYTVITASMSSAETVSLLDFVKYDVITRMNQP